MPVMEVILLFNCKGNRDYGTDIFVNGVVVCATVANFGGISGGNLGDIGFGFADCVKVTA